MSFLRFRRERISHTHCWKTLAQTFAPRESSRAAVTPNSNVMSLSMNVPLERGTLLPSPPPLFTFSVKRPVRPNFVYVCDGIDEW